MFRGKRDPPEASEKAGEVAVESRRPFRGASSRRYGIMLPMDYHVSGAFLELIIGRHRRRRAVSVDLENVASLLGASGGARTEKAGWGPVSARGSLGVLAQGVRCAPIRDLEGQLRTFTVLFVRLGFCAGY